MRTRFLSCVLFIVPVSIVHGWGISPQPYAPTFETQPANTSVYQGYAAQFSASAIGFPAPTYQWRKNGVNIPGAISSILNLSDIQFSAAGTYDVVAYNSEGRANSRAATLTVLTPIPASISRQPASTTVEAGQTTTLSVVATGTALFYQWKKNDLIVPGATSASYTIIRAVAADMGSYSVVVSNRTNSVESDKAALTVLLPVLTAITKQPGSMSLINADQTATFSVVATGSDLTYQWKKNGVAIVGATNPNYTVAAATARDMGFYSVVVQGGADSVESSIAILTVSTGGTSRLSDLSTRGVVPAGGNLTAGFVLRGTGHKSLLVRAVGPTLGSFGVAGTLADPRLEIVATATGRAVGSCDDWGGGTTLANAFVGVGAFALPAASKDAAVLAPFAPASYTARITSSVPGGSGIAMVEVYDSDDASPVSRLVNVSALGFVGSEAQALAPGFVISGTEPKRLLLRAVGPGLAPLGVDGTLADPQLAVIPAGHLFIVARNDNWDASAALADAFTQARAFALVPGSRDAALVVTLPPGGYTVQVSGADSTTGKALVEIYDLDP